MVVVVVSRKGELAVDGKCQTQHWEDGSAWTRMAVGASDQRSSRVAGACASWAKCKRGAARPRRVEGACPSATERLPEPLISDHLRSSLISESPDI